jgi:uncharacterized membrane protein YdjX (TVP38/TMEM64 family)
MQLTSNLNTRTIILFVSLLLTTLISLFITFFYGSVTTLFFKILTTSFLAGAFLAFLYSYKQKSVKLYRLLFLVIISVSIFVISYVLLKRLNILDLFESAEEMKEFILSTGSAGRWIFFLIQFIQVVLIPIPAIITTLAGVAIYGPFEAAIISTLAIVAGSLFAFFVMGRIFGYKLVKWIAGEETTEKYSRLLNEKGKYLFVLMLIFPIFPDDILSMIAGITKMSGRFFTLITVIIRPITTFAMCYFVWHFGVNQIIPYSGWGLIAWPIIIIITGAIFIWTYKNSEKIEYFVTHKILKNKDEI